MVKARFVKESDRAVLLKRRKSKNAPARTGFGLRVAFTTGSPPSIAEWRNTLLHCSERLRHSFSPELLERVTFTAISNSEQDYRVEAELLFPTPTKIKVHEPRTDLRFRTGAT